MKFKRRFEELETNNDCDICGYRAITSCISSVETTNKGVIRCCRSCTQHIYGVTCDQNGAQATLAKSCDWCNNPSFMNWPRDAKDVFTTPPDFDKMMADFHRAAKEHHEKKQRLWNDGSKDTKETWSTTVGFLMFMIAHPKYFEVKNNPDISTILDHITFKCEDFNQVKEDIEKLRKHPLVIKHKMFPCEN